MDAVRHPLTQLLKGEAYRLGFESVGVCPAVTATGVTRLRDWLARGYAGEMGYFAKRATAYEHPRHVLEGVRSLVMLTVNYNTRPAGAAGPGQGRVSRYAWSGVDYHDHVRRRLDRLADMLRQHAPGSLVRGVVDTAPLLEREFAQLAGLGWIGKNTMLLSRHAGSWFFLAALLTDVELQYDGAHQTDHCGSCTACLDACPTGAFPRPYVLDATRCVSYLTIELRGPIPRELRAGVGDWVFGCDVCQDVCPWNRRAPHSLLPEVHPDRRMDPLDLCSLFYLDDGAFRQRFRRTPLWRAKRRGLLRNAAIVLGNQRPPEAIDALCHGLADAEPLVRAACAWALGQYEDPRAAAALRARLQQETDTAVRDELAAALAD